MKKNCQSPPGTDAYKILCKTIQKNKTTYNEN